MNIARKNETKASELWCHLKNKLTQSQADLTGSSLQIIHEFYVENFSSIVEENEKLKAQLQLTPSDKRDDSEESTNRGTISKRKRSLFSDSSDYAFNKAILESELKDFKRICEVDVQDMSQSDDLGLLLNEASFGNFANNVREQCPTLTHMIETIAIGDWTKYNTGKKSCSFKFKSAIQLLLALDDIKTQKSTTNFSTLFGLLLISHGAGKALIQALEPFGLCKSYSF